LWQRSRAAESGIAFITRTAGSPSVTRGQLVGSFPSTRRFSSMPRIELHPDRAKDNNRTADETTLVNSTARKNRILLVPRSTVVRRDVAAPHELRGFPVEMPAAARRPPGKPVLEVLSVCYSHIG
jgi:hypothetical protein